ncbi:MAG: exopolysaccharide biosynthesis protein [Parachlamydiaceae bacterium]
MEAKKPKFYSLEENIKRLLKQADGKDIDLETILLTLAGKGYAILLILFSFPFCLPITIPGLSTPFGLAIIYIGLRLALGDHPWLPKRLLRKKIPFSSIQKVSDMTIRATNKLQFLVRPRWVRIVKTPKLYVLHGLIIALLGFFLCLPLPVPFSNTVSALPIIFFGLALLEDDGLFIIIAYCFTLLCLSFFVLLVWLGKSGIYYILRSFNPV